MLNVPFLEELKLQSMYFKISISPQGTQIFRFISIKWSRDRILQLKGLQYDEESHVSKFAWKVLGDTSLNKEF